MGMGLSSHGSCLHLALIPQLVVVRAALSEDTGVYLLISPLLSHTLVPRILTLELRAESRLLVRPAMIKRKSGSLSCHLLSNTGSHYMDNKRFLHTDVLQNALFMSHN